MNFPIAQFHKHIAETKAKAAKSKPKPKDLETMEIHKATNGGYIAKHRFSQPDEIGKYQEPEEHVLANSKHLLAHVKQHMGDS